MGQMCCKTKTEEGITYEDNFNDFYKDEMKTGVQTTSFFDIKKGNEVTNAKTAVAENPRFLFDLDKLDAESNKDNKNQINNSFNVMGSITKENVEGKDGSTAKNLVNLQEANRINSLNILSELSNQVNKNSDTMKNQTSSFQRASISKESNGLKQLYTGTDEQFQQNNRELKLLKLTIRETKFNQIGQELKINNNGLVGSTRNANDGSVFFGQKGASFVNDFILQQEEGINPKHFEIKYEKNLNDYFIKNIKGSGVFIKIEKPLALRDGMIISFGTNHIMIKISTVDNDQKDSAISNITFKAIYGPNKGNT